MDTWIHVKHSSMAGEADRKLRWVGKVGGKVGGQPGIAHSLNIDHFSVHSAATWRLRDL